MVCVQYTYNYRFYKYILSQTLLLAESQPHLEFCNLYVMYNRDNAKNFRDILWRKKANLSNTGIFIAKIVIFEVCRICYLYVPERLVWDQWITNCRTIFLSWNLNWEKRLKFSKALPTTAESLSMFGNRWVVLMVSKVSWSDNFRHIFMGICKNGNICHKKWKHRRIAK